MGSTIVKEKKSEDSEEVDKESEVESEDSEKWDIRLTWQVEDHRNRVREYEQIQSHIPSDTCLEEWGNWLREYEQVQSDDIPSELFEKLANFLLRFVQGNNHDLLTEAYEKVPLARRATITSSRETALHLALKRDDFLAVYQMLENVGPEDLKIQDENGDTAIHCAIRKKRKYECKRMLDISPELVNIRNKNRDTPLILAVQYGYVHSSGDQLYPWEDVCIDMIKKYNMENSLLFAKNSHSNTALHLAVTSGFEKLCSLLIDRASAKDLRLEDENGDTALNLSIRKRMQKLCTLMLKKSPQLVNTLNRNGDTPLILAAYNDMEGLCVHMMERWKDANIFVQNSDSDTAFHLAVSKGMMHLCRLLVNLALTNDLLVKDRRGNTVIHLALDNGNFEMAYRMLQRRLINVLNEREKGTKVLDTFARKASPVISSIAQLGAIDRCIYYCIPHAALERAFNDEDDFCKEESNKSLFKFFKISFTALWLKFMHKNPTSTSTDQPRDGENLPRASTDQSRDEENLGSTSIMHNDLPSTSTPQPRDEENPPTPKPRVEVNLPSTSLHNARNNHEGVQKLKSWLHKIFYKFFALMLGERVKRITIKKLQHLRVCYLCYNLVPSGVSPIFIAAELGVTEVVKQILNDKAEAIHEKRSSDCKNAVLLAAENRRFDVYELLHHHCIKNNIPLKDVFGHKDKGGNNALHLVAKFSRNRRPWQLPGNKQMHWEYKCYEYVKNFVPKDLWKARNHEGVTPAELFKKEHEHLYKSDDKGEWVSVTSQACSVVAGLIATVAFNSATSIPGSNNEKGNPNLRGHPALNTFVISAFIALFFSLISLSIFLSILISPFDDLNDRLNYDISKSLPKELIKGLSTLLFSIVAMLVSFCAGHYFYFKGTMRFVAIPIYMIGCFIIAYFFYKVFCIFLSYTPTSKPDPWIFLSYTPTSKPDPWYEDISEDISQDTSEDISKDISK